jgi:hypothetical protein
MGPAEHHHALVSGVQHWADDDVRLVERTPRHDEVDLATA